MALPTPLHGGEGGSDTVGIICLKILDYFTGLFSLKIVPLIFQKKRS